MKLSRGHQRSPSSPPSSSKTKQNGCQSIWLHLCSTNLNQCWFCFSVINEKSKGLNFNFLKKKKKGLTAQMLYECLSAFFVWFKEGRRSNFTQISFFVICRSSSGQHPVRSGDHISIQPPGPHIQGKMLKTLIFILISQRKQCIWTEFTATQPSSCKTPLLCKPLQ